MITVKASQHPLIDDWVIAEVDPDQTIAEICGTTKIHAWVDGKAVDAELLDTWRVCDGTLIIVRPVPADDGILRSVLVLGAVLAGGWLGGAVAGAIGVSGFAADVLVATGALALSTLTNVLVPLPKPTLSGTGDQSFNRLQSLTGASNQVARFQPIPRLYGRHRFFPPIPMTALPFTEIQGADQYLRMMLVLGYGPLLIGGVRVGGPADGVITQDTELSGAPILIGETDIHEFDAVEFEIGRPDQITLYTNQVIEIAPAWTTKTDVSGFDPGASGRWVANGESAIRSTEPNTDEISITVEGALFTINSEGRTREARIDWKVEYSPYGQNVWTVVQDPWRTSSVKRETARFGLRWKVPRGQYDVRLTRVQTYIDDFEAVQDEMTWSALRSIRSVTPWVVPDTVIMALRIKATDQLNGLLDDLSVEATSILPVWNGMEWIEQATRNPAWIYADIWTGTANRRPLSKDRLDVAALSDWANDCDARAFSYDMVLDSAGTTLERAIEVCACGRASWNVTNDAKISVVRDIPQTTPKMLIGPRNSYGFQYQLRNADVPDALRVQFIDSTTWENTERLVFDDGYDEGNAQKYDTIEARGVTDPDHAWRFGRYNLAQLKLRPETYTFVQDVQHLRYNRGDLLEYRHDVIAVGIADGRVRDVTTDPVSGLVTKFRSDEYLYMTDPLKSYGIRVQHSDGSVETLQLVTEVPGTWTPTLTTPSTIAVDDYFLFGELGRESIRVKVTSIEPQGDLTARVTCVPEAPNIHDADTGVIPPYDAGLTWPVDLSRLPLPIPSITRIASDESVLIRDADGSMRIRMVVESSVPAFPGWGGSRQVRYRPLASVDAETLTWLLTEESTQDSISIFDVEEGVTYEVQVRSVRSNGTQVSAWTPSQYHTVVGKSSPPHDVTGFEAHAAIDRVELSWAAVPDPDVGGYEVREGETWESAVLVVRTSALKHQTRTPSNGPWWIKAYDTHTPPNYSVNAVGATISVVLPQSKDVSAQVIDNNVLLRWQTIPGTFRLRTHEIRKGVELTTAVVVGASDKTFDIIQEITEGDYTYWVVPIDEAGNYGIASSVVAAVAAPPDFVLNNNFQTDWEGLSVTNLQPMLSIPLPARLTTRDTTALEFDGVDDYVQVPYDASMDLSVYTYEFLVHVLNYPESDGVLVSKGYYGNPGIFLSPDGAVYVMQFTGTDYISAGTPSYAVQTGRWHRVSCVLDGINMLVYIDGVLMASTPAGAVVTNTDPLWFAGTPAGDCSNVRLADIRQWSVARTQTEIQSTMWRTLGGDEPGLNGYWRVQTETLGTTGFTTLPDMTGHGHDGAISGATRYIADVSAVAPTADYSRDQLTALGYSSRDAMIAAGLNYRVQPTPDTAQFVEVYDAGAVITSTNIRVTLDSTAVVGAATLAVQISTRKALTDPWTDFPVDMNPVFASDFRYVKVTVNISKDAVDDTSFVELREINTVLSRKLKPDSGSVFVAANPTWVPFNIPFVDVRSINATPQGDTSLVATTDFDDVPNPTGFKVWLFDNSGNEATGVVRWTARGV